MRAFAVLAALVAVASAGAARGVSRVPAEGLVVDTANGRVELRGLDGALVRRLDGYRLDQPSVPVPGLQQLRDRRGRAWTLGGRAGLRLQAGGIPLRAGAALVLGRRRWWVALGGARLWGASNRAGLPLVARGRDVVSVRGRALDVRTRGFVRLPTGCAATDRRGTTWVLLCGGRSYAPQRIVLWSGGRRRLVAAKPFRGGVGHWVSALVSPDGTRLLAQWSAECEVPIAFLGPVRGPLRAVAAHGRAVPTSGALGWAGDGRAVVALPEGACGGSVSRPGVYLVGADGRQRLVTPATGIRTRVAFWGA